MQINDVQLNAEAWLLERQIAFARAERFGLASRPGASQKGWKAFAFVLFGAFANEPEARPAAARPVRGPLRIPSEEV
jgi:hypothetical protein